MDRDLWWRIREKTRWKSILFVKLSGLIPCPNIFAIKCGKENSNIPKQEIIVQPGIQQVIYYTAKNLSNKPTTGTAVFNVSPPKAGSIFMKVDCFCFVKQTLQPGEEVKMPVSFYVDPSINEDENTKNLEEITLSYTFFNAET